MINLLRKLTVFAFALIVNCSTSTLAIAEFDMRDIVTRCILFNALKNDPEINHNNFAIAVKKGEVHLYGVAKSHSEQGKALDHATKLRFAIKILNYTQVNKGTVPKKHPIDLKIENICAAAETGSDKKIDKAFSELWRFVDNNKK